jgi:hypothetical protein
MRVFLILSMAMILIGCTPQPFPAQPRIVNPAFETYVQSFEATWGNTAEMTIEFSTLNNNLVGLCSITSGTYKYGTRTIQIDSTYWNDIDSDGQEQLIYHEMGHCALGRMHWSALDNNTACQTYTLAGTWVSGCPLTIMYPVAFGNNGFYAQDRTYFWSELFANNPTHEDPNQSSLTPQGDYFIDGANPTKK